jgi:VWFA-related protein
MLGFIIFLVPLPVAYAQAPSATSQAPPADTPQNAPKPDTKATNDEIVSHDSPATFKVRVNVVLVRVVVRDNNGKVIKDLKKEDFQLADERKPQVISSFSVETPLSQAPTAKTDPADTGSEQAQVKAPELPERFVTLFFDDSHLSTQDAMVSRQAATKLFATMATGDRLAIFSTSGQVEQDFTADRGRLEEALKRILRHSLSMDSPMDCPPMSYYEAYSIVYGKDAGALQTAIEDILNCMGPLDQTAATHLAEGTAQRELNIEEAQLQRTYQNLEALIRRMSVLPGRRVIVMMSPGFFVTPGMQWTSEVIDRATKANVVIDTIDARGLWVESTYDASNPGTSSPIKQQFERAEQLMKGDVLGELADGTGGSFFHNRNDIDQGLLQAAAEPEVSYVLGFAPQDLKLDGKYHHLKVTLVNKEKWVLQSRHGYYAPRLASDPAAAAKEEIRQAVFSQEELHDLPMECKTQFFKSANGANLTVVTHFETKGVKFRRADDRNDDNFTISTAIFDENGNLFMGQERILELRLKDATLERVNTAGLTVKASFDLQPGSFLVRVVVRDSEGAQMAGTTRGVVIP